MLEGAGSKAGLLLKFDQLIPGDERLIGPTEMCGGGDGDEIVTDPDRRIASKVVYKTGSGSSRERG